MATPMPLGGLQHFKAFKVSLILEKSAHSCRTIEILIGMKIVYRYYCSRVAPATFFGDKTRYKSPVSGTGVTRVGAPVAWGPRIIDKADPVVAYASVTDTFKSRPTLNWIKLP
ncbi:hypothetical protein TNCV_48591 [Trichonephila clavipes]|nr:hypothetical protein TNCV_48591 [Trichonephila clavipes]